MTRRGTVRVCVSLVAPGHFLWSLEDRVPERQTQLGLPNLPMLTVGRQGTILFMNRAAREFFGDRKTRLDDFFIAQSPRNGVVNVIRTKSGPRNCFIFENKLSAGRTEVFFAPATAQKQSEGISFDELPTAAMKIAPDGKILLANRVARDMIGPKLAGETYLSELMEGLGRPLADWLAEAIEGRAQKLNEFMRLKDDTKETYVQVTLGRMEEPDGEFSLFTVLHDATELKTLEAQFVQSQKMQAIGQLAGGVAHDFNNLLTAISGHCDLLLLRHEQDDTDYSDLTQIHQNANRAAALVRQLLAYSRKQTLQPVTLDLREALSDLTHLLNRLVGEKVELSVAHDPALSVVRVDRQQFEQVIMNLVVNARDSMPDGGQISITTENTKLEMSKSRDRAVIPKGDYVCIKVADQGSGIPENNRDKVFEPFYTTKNTGEGTGLGLSTAYGIIKQSGGFIFLDSTVGEGTTFTVFLPAASKDPLQYTEPPTANALGPQTGTGVVLLVEDEAPVRSFAARALRMKGFTVLEAACAEDALETLRDRALQIDLFVTDVVMPGMDGPTWVKEARITRPDVPVIFMSGYTDDIFSDSNPQVPDSHFLPKPFSLSELTGAVERQIARPLADAVV
jgi:two-component system cell cycle sensor histidine kinase/response regulator CckA